jgi:hypothetical protein
MSIENFIFYQITFKNRNNLQYPAKDGEENSYTKDNQNTSPLTATFRIEQHNPCVSMARRSKEVIRDCIP